MATSRPKFGGPLLVGMSPALPSNTTPSHGGLIHNELTFRRHVSSIQHRWSRAQATDISSTCAAVSRSLVSPLQGFIGICADSPWVWSPNTARFRAWVVLFGSWRNGVFSHSFGEHRSNRHGAPVIVFRIAYLGLPIEIKWS